MARSSLLLYGNTNTYKTTAVGLAARYVFETTGKGCLLFTASTDGWATVGEEVVIVVGGLCLGVADRYLHRYFLRSRINVTDILARLQRPEDRNKSLRNTDRDANTYRCDESA